MAPAALGISWSCDRVRTPGDPTSTLITPSRSRRMRLGEAFDGIDDNNDGDNDENDNDDCNDDCDDFDDCSDIEEDGCGPIIVKDGRRHGKRKLVQYGNTRGKLITVA